MVKAVRRHRPDISFCLEAITRDPLRVPCLDERYFATLPDLPASDLARTLRTVRAHATDGLLRVSSLSMEEQASHERKIVATSLEYAREQLGL
jgi:hypothetical protein